MINRYIIKIIVLFFLFLFISKSGYSQCIHYINLYDTWGDGWTGGSVTVTVNGVPVLTNITCASTGPDAFSFLASTGDAIQVTFSAGSYPGENYFDIFEGNGVAIASGYFPNSSGTWNGVGACPIPTNACSGTIYDTGGAGGNYSNNENYLKTYCSNAGNCISITFNSFDVEYGYDFLTIYDGPGMTSASMGDYTGTSLNGVTFTSLTGCLTLLFTSDGSTTSSGWNATISCAACPAVGPCGNPQNNDYCSDPAVLTSGGLGWSSSTTSIFTPDQTQLGSDYFGVFCGSIENNSWYQFTATSTTATFNFNSITGCTDGVQAQVFSVTTNASGCCVGFTPVSNCYSPGNTSTGSVSATGLTVGNTYILMVDGFAGATCNFNVSNWTATGVLPVTLTNFSGYKYKGGNKLVWTTASEINNDFFILQKSANAKNYVDVGIIDGHGNSNVVNNYEYFDYSPFSNITYYRLKQFDFDGAYQYSKIIALKANNDFDIKIYPNPAINKLFFDVSDSYNETYTILYSNVLGNMFKEQVEISKGTNTYELQKFNNLTSGLYFIQILNKNHEVIKIQKIVKE